jgi:DNA-binding transcriptional ArsR family regulator
MTKEELEGYLAQGLSLEQIGKRVGRDPSTVSYHLKKYGLIPVGQAIHAPNQKVDPDALGKLMTDGATVRAAAEHFGVGYSTIRYWLKKLDIETSRMKRIRESNTAIEAGQARAVLTCPEHGEVEFLRRPDGNYRCSKCRSASVSAWRRRVKRRLIERAGGCCVLCGYDRHPATLHFHHVDPAAKSFILSRHGVTRSFREAAAEADKCVLLCGNCHAEVEAGHAELPTDVLPLQLAKRRAS